VWIVRFTVRSSRKSPDNDPHFDPDKRMEMTRKKKNPRFTQQNDEQLREDYQVKFTDSFVALENLDDRGDIKTAGEGGRGGGKY